MIARAFYRWALVSYLLTGALGACAMGAQSRLFDAARNRMVDEDVAAAGVKDKRVLEAMRATPRHEFVPVAQRKNAYFDMALPIGEGQTISPPLVVASMTESLDPQPDDKVLEIGTGSGYQAAVLSPLVREVYTIEIVPALGNAAARTLKRLRYSNVHVKVGDGYQGWPSEAPFDKIIVTCSPERVPENLVEQLKEGGRMIIPVGERYQQTLYVMKKVDGKIVSEALQPTLFVPMTGQAEAARQIKPDGAHPEIVNGDFEESIDDPPRPAAWYYQRQLALKYGPDAAQGRGYVMFHNAEPGRGCHALQGFAIDGRKIERVEISLQVRGQNIRAGQSPQQLPMLVMTFYDENRATIGQGSLGPWQGTFGWRRQTGQIEVPPRAREAIVRIGLLGAVGEASFDAIELKVLVGRQHAASGKQ